MQMMIAQQQAAQAAQNNAHHDAGADKEPAETAEDR